MSNDIQRRVFISYASEEHVFAELVLSKLKENGIDAWIDTESIKAGYDWRKEIDDGIIDSDIVVVILDENSSKSPYVIYEWSFALGKGKRVIPIKSKDCEVHARLNVLQYLDFTHRAKPWDKLLKRILAENTESNFLNCLSACVETINELRSYTISYNSSPSNDALNQLIGKLNDVSKIARRLIMSYEKSSDSFKLSKLWELGQFKNLYNDFQNSIQALIKIRHEIGDDEYIQMFNELIVIISQMVPPLNIMHNIEFNLLVNRDK